MKTYTYKATLQLNISVDEAWEFFTNPNNLSRIMPSELNFKVIDEVELPLYEGQIISYSVTPLPFFKTSWVSEISHIKAPDYFIDTQIEGPYKLWHHKHFIKPTHNGCEVTDVVHYQVPFGIIGKALHPFIIKPQLDKIFIHRSKEIKKYSNEKYTFNRGIIRYRCRDR